MTLEEYKKRVEEDEDWAPGWEAIEDRLKEIYKDQEPKHFGTTIHSRAMFGGDNYLDGYSIYQSANGYKHCVTFGMSELYVNEDEFGAEYSKWGYEMTIKLPVDTDDECMWAIDMLSNLARYTFTKERYFEPFQYIAGNGTSIKIGEDSKLTALLIVEDTELSGIDTVHGRLDFMQLVGITQKELEAVMETPDKSKELVENMKKDNPMLITDLSRTKDYL